MISRYTVFGQPIAHSLSPTIHQLFGELTQRKVQYTRTEATPESFLRQVLDWQAGGARGCNVTAPFKEQAREVCDRLSSTAERAASVNTIHFHPDGSRSGHNTDGEGLLIDLTVNLQRSLTSRRLLLLGAGGAARGVVESLLSANPQSLLIVNRTTSKAQAVAQQFVAHGPVQGDGFEALGSAAPFDVVINATSLSLSGEVPHLPDSVFAGNALAYDMVYGPTETPFLQWSRQRGADVSNGLGMLVEQAAEAFFIWEGVRPKTRMIYPQLRDILKTE